MMQACDNLQIQARLRWPDWEGVTALAWSRDGNRLAAGTQTGAISLFDLSKGLSA
jgi:anaphase-promoting complex subunit 4